MASRCTEGNRLRLVIWCVSYLAATVLTLWIVAASVISPGARVTVARDATATRPPTPTALEDLASRVFAPLTDTGPSATPSARASIAFTREAAERGSTLFVIKGCVLCHGQRAEGQFGPRIAHTVLPFEDVKRQARTPRNVYMPAFTPPLLSEEELTDIYVFLQSLPAE